FYSDINMNLRRSKFHIELWKRDASDCRDAKHRVSTYASRIHEQAKKIPGIAGDFFCLDMRLNLFHKIAFWLRAHQFVYHLATLDKQDSRNRSNAIVHRHL